MLKSPHPPLSSLRWIEVEVVNEESRAPTRLAPCVPEGMYVRELAGPDIEITAPIFEFSAPLGIEIEVVNVLIEGKSAWNSGQTWSRERGVFKLCPNMLHGIVKCHTGVQGWFFWWSILEKGQFTSSDFAGNGVGSNLQPYSRIREEGQFTSSDFAGSGVGSNSQPHSNTTVMR